MSGGVRHGRCSIALGRGYGVAAGQQVGGASWRAGGVYFEQVVYVKFVANSNGIVQERPAFVPDVDRSECSRLALMVLHNGIATARRFTKFGLPAILPKPLLNSPFHMCMIHQLRLIIPYVYTMPLVSNRIYLFFAMTL